MGVPRTVFLALAAALSLAATAALAIGAPLNTLYGLSLLMGGCRFGCGHRWCVCVFGWLELLPVGHCGLHSAIHCC